VGARDYYQPPAERAGALVLGDNRQPGAATRSLRPATYRPGISIAIRHRTDHRLILLPHRTIAPYW